MKLMDYVVTGAGARRTIAPRSERAKQRTPEAQEFATNDEALAFVRAGVAEGFRFSGQQLVDREYKLVRYGYFIDTGGRLVRSGGDWGPPDPSFEPGDVYPRGPRNGKHAAITAVISRDDARRNGVDVTRFPTDRHVSGAD